MGEAPPEYPHRSVRLVEGRRTGASGEQPTFPAGEAGAGGRGNRRPVV